MGLNTKAIGVGIHSPNDFAFLNMSSFGNKKFSPPCPSFTYHLSPLHHSLLIALLNCFLITLIQDLYLRLLLRSLLRCLLYLMVLPPTTESPRNSTRVSKPPVYLHDYYCFSIFLSMILNLIVRLALIPFGSKQWQKQAL